MPKPIEASRTVNEALAGRLTEMIQEAVEAIEKDSQWLTLTIEISAEAGKLRHVRLISNQTWKEGPAKNGVPQVLTR